MQPGLFLMILQQVWAPSMASVEGPSEEKLLAVATCRCLAELQPLQQARPAWEAVQQALAAKVQGAGQQELAGERGAPWAGCLRSPGMLVPWQRWCPVSSCLALSCLAPK